MSIPNELQTLLPACVDCCYDFHHDIYVHFDFYLYCYRYHYYHDDY